MTTTHDQDNAEQSGPDVPATRKAAEKAAAALLQQQLLGPISDLFDARQVLGTEVLEVAEAEAQRILAEAHERAERVRQEARERQDEAHASYASAYRAAQERGWTADQLDELGYTKPKRGRKTRTRKRTTTADSHESAVGAATDTTGEHHDSIGYAPGQGESGN